MVKVQEFRIRDQANDVIGDLLQLMTDDGPDMLRQMRLRIERVIDAAEAEGERLREEKLRALVAEWRREGDRLWKLHKLDPAVELYRCAGQLEAMLKEAP